MVFLNLLFWAFLASYIVHILDETLLNGGFVQWIIDNFWPTYTWRMFFWFNAGAIAAIVTSNLLFDSLGGHWVILPLIFLAGFVTHAATIHVGGIERRIPYWPPRATKRRKRPVYRGCINKDPRFGPNRNVWMISRT